MVGEQISEADVWRWLEQVPDPEIPVLSIVDLGIVREVCVGDSVTVAVAPTYSGCPATEVIEQTVRGALLERGVVAPSVERRLSPPWTTDWISAEGRRKLRDYGIAPPEEHASAITCPQCNSTRTERVSEFGSTACKASWRCLDCLEPFEYFKCL